MVSTYADDTYVVIEAENWRDMDEKVQNCLNKHLKFLEDKGMVCNIGKTEVMNFCDNHQSKITVMNQELTSVKCIKALGVMLDNNLTWTTHVDNLLARTSKILNGIKIIKKKFTMEQRRSIVTSQVFGVLYYAAACWLTPNLSNVNFRKLNKIHYAACRIICNDWRKIWSKDSLNQATKRLPPKTWLKYNAASFIVKVTRDESPSVICADIEANLYHNPRHLNPKLRDLSRRKIGKNCLQNWTGQIMNQIDFKWYGTILSNDRLRILLKKNFYPPNY